MKMKKCLVSCLLVALISIPPMKVFAANQTSMRIFEPNAQNNSIVSDFSLKTVDGQEVHIPNVDKSQQLDNKVKSTSQANYSQTKAVADEKASTLINKDYGSTSVQYALIDNGKIVLSGNAGVYSKEDNKPVTADNMYGIGSVSKMFVTTAVMKLVDEGKIELDAPVTKYIKEFKMADGRYKKITVRMLLNHSSGLMGSSFSNAILFGDNDTYSHDTFLKQLSKQRLKADPGAYSVYCNDGFSLAEILVERVAGVSYTTYITNNITDILKMNNTKTPASKFDRNKLVKTYYDGVPNALPVENLNSFGAGGVYSSAEDLCTFANTFTKNSNGILLKKALKAMENKEYLRGIWPEGKDNILAYGLGWDSVNLYPFNQYNIKALCKGGDSEFYHSGFIVLPEQNMAMAVVSSGGLSTYDEVMAERVLLTALKEKGVIKNIIPDKTFTPPQETAVPSEIKKYEGSYLAPSGFINAKIDDAGKLTLLNTQNQPMQTYIYTKGGSFVSSDGSTSMKFVTERNGRIYLQETIYSNMKYLGQTVENLYIAQKEDGNKLKENVAKAWEKRSGKRYVLLNEKYSSVEYMMGCPMALIAFTKGFEGYLGVDKIADKNLAVAILDGPGVMSRDQQDYKLYKKNNLEYLSSNGGIYIDQDALKTLPIDGTFSSTINKDGYAEWYKIGDEAAGKEINVDIPQNAAFAVYDSNGAVINDSLVTGSTSAKLPQNGTIVFLGSPQAKFTIKYNIVLK
ncbi:serine hydrolase domain-containing protein [Clostridium acetobutylicum]|uniref:serine hydrolase domain-containing protein n=1 Tax=Clostridium acetobutylicum TaxID=1488 RepID=UPI0015715388|nr:serine hydrolase domain-containing protein [Clostridium acetobutylicum]NRY55912.1 CubicO group peptidase (beta-lactamase class C family) [Clostridium acetobutylicum]